MTILESPHMFFNRTTLPQTYWPSRCWFSIAKVFLLEFCGGLFLSNKVLFLVGPVGQFTVWVALIKWSKIMFWIHKQYKGFFINFKFFEITVMWRPKWACCVLHYYQMTLSIANACALENFIVVESWAREHVFAYHAHILTSYAVLCCY